MCYSNCSKDKHMDTADRLDGHLCGHASQSMAHLQNIRDNTESEKDRDQRHASRLLHSRSDSVRCLHRRHLANARYH